MFFNFGNTKPTKPFDDEPETPVFNTEPAITNLTHIKPAARTKMLGILRIGLPRLKPAERKKTLERIIDLEEAGYISDKGPIREESHLFPSQEHAPFEESTNLEKRV